MRDFFRPVGRDVPIWLTNILNSIRNGLKDPFDWPIRLWKVPTASLPTFSEADHEGAILYDTTLDRLTYGNHTAWVTLADYDASVATIAALSIVQGDLIYGSASETFSRLAKDTNATRYLSNTGASNNPAWAQINLANGVTGDLPFANFTQGSALSVLGVTGNATADFASIAAGSDHQVLRRSGTALTFGAVNLAQSAAVTGILPVANSDTGTSGTKLALLDGANTWSGTQTFNTSASGATNITGNRSLASWGNSGPNLRISANTLTNTSSAGGATLTTQSANSFMQPTFAFSNATVTVTDAINVYIDDAPAVGANGAFTRSWALYIAAGGLRVGGAFTVTGNATIGDNTSDAHAITGQVTLTESTGAGLILKDSAGNGTAADVNIEFQGADAVVKGSMGPSSSGTSNIDVNSASGDVRILASNALQATFDTDGINLVSGNWYEINGVQVVTSRQTGWSADSGTAKRTANTTYTAASISSPPTQAEVQAIANALQDASRTIKALKDDLITHGLIGA